jgi:hypothetical protein
VGRHCVDIFARHLHLQLGDALAQEFLVGHDCLVVIGFNTTSSAFHTPPSSTQVRQLTRAE